MNPWATPIAGPRPGTTRDYSSPPSRRSESRRSINILNDQEMMPRDNDESMLHADFVIPSRRPASVGSSGHPVLPSHDPRRPAVLATPTQRRLAATAVAAPAIAAVASELETPQRRPMADGYRDFVVRILVGDRAHGGAASATGNSRSPSPSAHVARSAPRGDGDSRSTSFADAAASNNGVGAPDPALPSSVVLSVRANSLASLVEQIETELAATHRLHFRIGSFQFTTFDGNGPWQAMPTTADVATGQTAWGVTPDITPDPSPQYIRVADAVTARSNYPHGHAAAALGMPDARGAAERVAHFTTIDGFTTTDASPLRQRMHEARYGHPLKSAVPHHHEQQHQRPRRFDLLPDRFLMRITPAARRLSFMVTVLLPSGSPRRAVAAQTGSGVLQRRAAAVVTTMQSLLRALSTLCQYKLEVRKHRVLFHDDAAGGYRPLASVAQLNTFSVLMVDLSHVTDADAFRMTETESAAAAQLDPNELNPSRPYQPTTAADYRAALAADGPVVDRGPVDAFDAVDHASRVQAQFVAPPHPAVTENVVPKLQKPTEESNIAARMAGKVPLARGDEVKASLRFRVPPRVKTPAAAADLPSTLPIPTPTQQQHKFALLAAEASQFDADVRGAHREELSDVETAMMLANHHFDYADPRSPPLPVPSVLPVPENDSPPREGLDLTAMAMREGATQFAPRPRSMVLRTPAVVAQNYPQHGPGPRGVMELDPIAEKKALIHETMLLVVAHPHKDYFPFGTLVRITSDVVQRFKRSYVGGIAVRFPLTRVDAETLRSLVDSTLKTELRDVAGGDRAFTPFVDNAGTRRTVEMIRLENDILAGRGPGGRGNSSVNGKPSSSFGDRRPQFESVSPERAYTEQRARAGTSLQPAQSTTPHEEYENARTPEAKRLPAPWQGVARTQPMLMLTRPQYDRSTDTLTIYAVTTIDIFGLTSEAIANQRRAHERLEMFGLRSDGVGASTSVVRVAPSAGGKTPASAFRWFLCQGSEAQNAGRVSGDVPLDAMIDLGIARMHVLQHTVPISLSLEISLVRRLEDDKIGEWTDALQVGIPYTVGIVVRESDTELSKSALMAFTIPSHFRRSQYPRSAAEEAERRLREGGTTPLQQQQQQQPQASVATAPRPSDSSTQQRGGMEEL